MIEAYYTNNIEQMHNIKKIIQESILSEYDKNYQTLMTNGLLALMNPKLNSEKLTSTIKNKIFDIPSYTQALKSLITSKDSIGTLMHKTLLTFKYNLKAVLNGATLPYSNGCLEGFNRKIKQIERTAFGYSNFINLLTIIRLEENQYKEKEPNSLLMTA